MESSAFGLIVISLGVWRAASIIRYESGPWDILSRVRAKLGDSILGKMMDCIPCMTLWLALLFLTVPGTKIIVIALAISAIAIIVEGFYDKKLLRPEREKSMVDREGTDTVHGNRQSM